MIENISPFSDPAMVARYVADTPRKVPGLADLHRMGMLLLAEHMPQAAEILVLGAGGGLELRTWAEAQPDWRFTGVDPSSEMLDLARRTLGSLQKRVALYKGYISDVPATRFDGAACLLTLHFLGAEERLDTLRELHRRLKPGSPFVVAHHSYPPGSDPQLWLARSIAFANKNAIDFAETYTSAKFMKARLPVLSSDQDEALLHEAGFSDIRLFYAGFSFRGWIARA